MKTLRPIIAIAVLVAFVFLVYRLVPPYFANYQFQDAMASEARNATYSTKSEQDIRDSVFKRAQELEIPVSQQQIVVHRVSGAVNISASYTVHVDLPGYPMDLQFTPTSSERRAF